MPARLRYATIKVGEQECSTVTLKDKTTAVWNKCCSFGTVLSDTGVTVVVKDQVGCPWGGAFGGTARAAPLSWIPIGRGRTT